MQGRGATTVPLNCVYYHGATQCHVQNFGFSIETKVEVFLSEDVTDCFNIVNVVLYFYTLTFFHGCLQRSSNWRFSNIAETVMSSRVSHPYCTLWTITKSYVIHLVYLSHQHLNMIHFRAWFKRYPAISTLVNFLSVCTFHRLNYPSAIVN